MQLSKQVAIWERGSRVLTWSRGGREEEETRSPSALQSSGRGMGRRRNLEWE
jgi:hypothetical protein